MKQLVKVNNVLRVKADFDSGASAKQAFASAVVLVLCTTMLHAQVVVTGGTDGRGGSGYLGPRPDAADALLLPPPDFQSRPVEVRRRIMAAWMAGQPEKAGTSLYQMLESGLLDPDAMVQRDSVNVLAKLVTTANLARYSKAKATGADPRTYPRFYDQSMKLLDHREKAVRQSAVGVLASFYIPPRPELENVILTRFSSEPSDSVRAAMIVALVAYARNGSARSTKLIIDEMHKESPLEVRTAAIRAMGFVKNPEAVPFLIALLEFNERRLRISAATSLGLYGPLTSAQMAQINAALDAEQDGQMRAAFARAAATVK